MIDFVHLSANLFVCEEEMQLNEWHTTINEEGLLYYWHIVRGVKIYYRPQQQKLTIKGKILTLLFDTQVLNADDIYATDIERFADDINRYLNALFTQPLLDIRTFHVYRIDYCFNVETPYAKEYVDFLNAAFKATDSGSRINHVQERDLDGSIYAKTKSDYEKNERRNYVLNFYDKLDWCVKKKAEGHHILAEDFEYAENILRLEVQCGYRFLDSFQKKHNVGCEFGDLFSYELAYHAVETVYRRVLRGDDQSDFYAYATAKRHFKPQTKAAKVLKRSSNHHKIIEQEYEYGVKQIKEEGVYPYCFLPKSLGIDMLENPLKLIQRKMADMGVDMTWL